MSAGSLTQQGAHTESCMTNALIFGHKPIDPQECLPPAIPSQRLDAGRIPSISAPPPQLPYPATLRSIGLVQLCYKPPPFTLSSPFSKQIVSFLT